MVLHIRVVQVAREVLEAQHKADRAKAASRKERLVSFPIFGQAYGIYTFVVIENWVIVTISFNSVCVDVTNKVLVGSISR